MDTIFALSSPKKAKALGQRINRQVTRVRSTKDLLEKVKLENEEHTFILVDLAMPSMSGGNAWKEIANMEVGNIPVIMLKDLDAFDPSRLGELGNPKYHKCSNSKQLFPKLHNPKSSRIDAQLIAAFFQLPLATIAKILRKSPKTVHKTTDAANLQDGLSILLRIACALMDLFGTESDARVWLNTPHPDLHNTQPMEYLKQGQSEVVVDLLEDFLLGHPG